MIAEAFQTFDQSASSVFRLQPVKKVGPGVAIGLLPLNHVVGHDQDRVGHCHNGALLATTCGEPPVLRLQIGALGPRGGVWRTMPAASMGP